MNDEYILLTDDGGSSDVLFYENEEAALKSVEHLMRVNPAMEEVALYKRIKTGRRVARVEWEVPRETPKAPERPPYQGANKRWSNDEVTYLKQARSMGMSFDGIAKKLGRSSHAVELKYGRL